MQPELILVGGGGHCRSCIDVIQLENAYRIAGIVDIKERLHQSVMGYEIIATDDALPELARRYDNFLITVGQIKNAHKRTTIYSNLKKLGVTLPVIVSPMAYVAPNATIENGTIVMHHAIVNSGAVLGINCIANTRALVEHEAVIGDHCHIATGAIVNGGARVGNRTFIGSLTMIRENLNIGANCVIGAGQVVLEDIKDNTILRSGD